MNNPPTRKGRVVKINYATQVSTAPPKFVLFCNYQNLFISHMLDILKINSERHLDLMDHLFLLALKRKMQKKIRIKKVPLNFRGTFLLSFRYYFYPISIRISYKIDSHSRIFKSYTSHFFMFFISIIIIISN